MEKLEKLRQSKIGEKHITNSGLYMEIIEYINHKNVRVKFEDGTVIENIKYANIVRGKVANPNYYKNIHIGTKHINTQGCEFEIIDYIDIHNITIKFNDEMGCVKENINFSSIKKGYIYNPYHKSVCGIGFIGEGDFISSKDDVKTKAYTVWGDILARCYDEKTQEKHPSYKGCSVSEEWHCFQNFAAWFEENYIEGFHLDKDILIKGNKLYSSETCCFVPHSINNLFKTKSMGKTKQTGVKKRGNKYLCYITKKGHPYYVGSYDTPEESRAAFILAKKQHIKEEVEIYKEQLPEYVYLAVINHDINTI